MERQDGGGYKNKTAHQRRAVRVCRHSDIARDFVDATQCRMDDVAVAEHVVQAEPRHEDRDHAVRVGRVIHARQGQNDHEERDQQRAHRRQEVGEQTHRLAGELFLNADIGSDAVARIHRQ